MACGERITRARLALGYRTQADLAHELGVNPDVLSIYESGKRGFPPTNLLIRLSETLGVTMDWLVKGHIDGLPMAAYRRLYTDAGDPT